MSAYCSVLSIRILDLFQLTMAHSLLQTQMGEAWKHADDEQRWRQIQVEDFSPNYYYATD